MDGFVLSEQDDDHPWRLLDLERRRGPLVDLVLGVGVAGLVSSDRPSDRGRSDDREVGDVDRIAPGVDDRQFPVVGVGRGDRLEERLEVRQERGLGPL